MVALSADALANVHMLFALDDRAQAIALLEQQCADNLPLFQNPTPARLDRVRFAVLKLSGGQVSALELWITRAKKDWRDVLVAADFGHDLNAHLHWHPTAAHP